MSKLPVAKIRVIDSGKGCITRRDYTLNARTRRRCLSWVDDKTCDALNEVVCVKKGTCPFFKERDGD